MQGVNKKLISLHKLISKPHHLQSHNISPLCPYNAGCQQKTDITTTLFVITQHCPLCPYNAGCQQKTDITSQADI